MLITISGPSGAGKSTLSTRIELEYGARILPSWTTRPPRISSEIDKKTYNYVGISDYFRMQANGAFILDENIASNYYGTKQVDLSLALADTEIWLADLTAKAVLKLCNKGFIPTLCVIFQISKSDSQHRMELRGDSSIDITNRIRRYDDELDNCNTVRKIHNNIVLVNGLADKNIIYKTVTEAIKRL